MPLDISTRNSIIAGLHDILPKVVRPARYTGNEDDPGVAAELDDLNERLMARINESGDVFLSHTRLRGRYTLRVAIGNLRTERRHVARVWELARQLGRELDEATPAAERPATA